MTFIAVVANWLPLISQVLDAVYESGCTFWDTADAYGDNEELIGKWYAHVSHKLSSRSWSSPIPARGSVT